MLAVDLAQGYHHVTIHPRDRKFLGFHWQNQYYVFNVLPFGLKSAPRIFTKVVLLLARSWRADGIRVLIYLDDWLILARPHEVNRIRERILANCRAAHVAINWAKSSLTGVTCLTHLGVVVDLQLNRFKVPPSKQVSIRAAIRELLRKGRSTARQLASVAGKIAALRLAIGPLTALFCRSLHRDIERASSWSEMITLQPDTSERGLAVLVAQRLV